MTKEVTTLAGGSSGPNDGTGTSAQFNDPYGLAISCNKLNVTDQKLYAIRVTDDTDTKEVTTVAGVKGSSGSDDETDTNANFTVPRGLQLGPADASTFYVRQTLVLSGVSSSSSCADELATCPQQQSSR